MSEAAFNTAPAFAPSELVILFGDRFVPEAGMLETKEEVLTSGVKVGSQALMEAAMKAALYAVHRSGAARLDVRAGKAMFGLMKRGMSERGLLEAQMKTTMMVFTTIDYVLPAATRAAAQAQPLEPVQQLLREAEQREPELDRAVQKAIDAARVRMTESRD